MRRLFKSLNRSSIFQTTSSSAGLLRSLRGPRHAQAIHSRARSDRSCLDCVDCRIRRVRFQEDGGEGGIRTPDSLTTMPDFESGAFNRALPPLRRVSQPSTSCKRVPPDTGSHKWLLQRGMPLGHIVRISYRPGMVESAVPPPAARLPIRLNRPPKPASTPPSSWHVPGHAHGAAPSQSALGRPILRNRTKLLDRGKSPPFCYRNRSAVYETIVRSFSACKREVGARVPGRMHPEKTSERRSAMR